MTREAQFLPQRHVPIHVYSCSVCDRTWEWPRHALINEWKMKMWYLYTWDLIQLKKKKKP